MITFIGNNANQKIVTDGGRLKMRLFIDLLKREGQVVGVIELDGWKKRFITIINQIKKAINRGDTLVIMAGPKGCRFIIPIVCHFNKKHKSRVVFCPVGIGTVHHLVKKLAPDQIDNFINCVEFYGIKDNKMKRLLNTLDYVCPENETQNTLYKTFYGLNNTRVVENFREIEIKPNSYCSPKNTFKIVYASRVKEYKGILDLMEVINQVNKESQTIVCLDIYGDNQLTEENSTIFQSLLNDNVKYYGALSTSEINSKIREYDLFCLPTKYTGEGTSGALVESMIAGTPSLVSSYSQANTLIKDNENGFIFKLGSKEDLKARLIEIISHKENLKKISLAAQESAKRYTYSYNRNTFLNIMIGGNK